MNVRSILLIGMVLFIFAGCSNDTSANAEDRFIEELRENGISVRLVESNLEKELTLAGHVPQIYQFEDEEELLILKYRYETIEERNAIFMAEVSGMVQLLMNPVGTKSENNFFYFVSTTSAKEMVELPEDSSKQKMDLIMKAALVADSYSD